MTADSRPEVLLPFKEWKVRFRIDCEDHNYLPAFKALGDSVIELLWQLGTEPTIKALLDRRDRNYSENGSALRR